MFRTSRLGSRGVSPYIVHHVISENILILYLHRALRLFLLFAWHNHSIEGNRVFFYQSSFLLFHWVLRVRYHPPSSLVDIS